MSRSVQIRVHPLVLKWARESSGATVEDAAKRAKVPSGIFAKWENKGTALSLTQARGLAAYFRRPLAAFLLSEPPPEPPMPRDFRTLPHAKDRFERDTRFAIRKARRLQTVAGELMQSLERDTSPPFEGAKVSDDPAAVASRERDRLGVSLDQQQDWQNEWEAFREWRAAIERQNILTLQLPITVEDVRGFSLGDQKPYVITVSSSDAVRARIFTLFHEYSHLLLHNAGICAPRFEANGQRQEFEVEQWCNRFAGEFLVPRSALELALPGRAQLETQALADALAAGAKTFKVSEAVMLFRLLHVGRVSKTTFRHTLAQLEVGARRAKHKGGPVRPARKCLAENGVLFSSLVLEARNRGAITHADVSDFLSVRLKHLPEIESSLMARAA
ncbi:MAG TPA: XRE family transcriptional regulator [Candidatus Acidoferrales bacterium]|nr:XRE family transcriptional regulator [Candidatus Acidoferrales bacterium]